MLADPRRSIIDAPLRRPEIKKELKNVVEDLRIAGLA